MIEKLGKFVCNKNSEFFLILLSNENVSCNQLQNSLELNKNFIFSLKFSLFCSKLRLYSQATK